MLILPGNAALSDFRREKLQKILTEKLGVDAVVTAEYIHFVDTVSSLDDDQLKVLKALLEYGPKQEKLVSEGELYLVVPRIGTISPWSSKATDIAHNCGLSSIKRIERGIVGGVFRQNRIELADENTHLRDEFDEALRHERDSEILTVL